MILRNQFLPAVLYSLAGRYDNPIPTQFLAPVDCLKIPALKVTRIGGTELGLGTDDTRALLLTQIDDFLTELQLGMGDIPTMRRI